jgi:hypothetical protein
MERERLLINLSTRLFVLTQHFIDSVHPINVLAHPDKQYELS